MLNGKIAAVRNVWWWKEACEGWRQGAWVWYFSFYAYPLMLLSTLLCWWIEGKPVDPDHPSTLNLVLSGMSGLFALWKVRHRLYWVLGKR